MPDLLRGYPLRMSPARGLLATANVVLPAAQAALLASWHERAFGMLTTADGPSRAYKWADATGWLPVDHALPSRVRRAVQEVAGRTLRSQAQRRDLYGLLRQADGALACRPADRERHATGSLLVLRNVAEAMGNWLRANDGELLPAAYTEFQAVPELITGVLTAAADDGPVNGQFVRYGLVDAGQAVWFRIKTPGPKNRWQWSDTHTVMLPEVVQHQLSTGWRLAAPDIRLKPDGRAFFDVHLALAAPKRMPFHKHPPRRVLGVDWA